MPAQPIPLAPATTLTTYHGKPVDLVTKQFVQCAEEALGFELTLLQGYNPDNLDTSAGTHGFGVVDLGPLRAQEKLHVWAQLGGWIWFREELPGVWPPHCHGGIRNHPGLSEPAKAQQRDFDGTPPRTGLKGHLVDDDVLAYRPKTPVQFVYDPNRGIHVPKPTKITQTRDALTEAIHGAAEAIAFLKDTDASRVVARAHRDEIRDAKRQLEQVLEVLPKR